MYSIANSFVWRNGPLAAKPYLQLDQLHLGLTKSYQGEAAWLAVERRAPFRDCLVLIAIGGKDAG